MVLALSIGCRTRNPNAADETNMALILAGEFQMGNNGPVEMYGPQAHEAPVHTVSVDAFYIDKYEVTNADFKKFLDANPEWQKDNVRFVMSQTDYPLPAGSSGITRRW